MAQQHFIGRRKTATARVYFKPGTGEFLVNNKPVDDYFTLDFHRAAAVFPLQLTQMNGKYDIKVTVAGGGQSGQAEAIQMGVARGIDALNEDLHSILKSNGLLTRDDRMVERKKYGQPKARKRFQFSKR